jgi:long-chain fatty acid transport protein
VTLAPFRVVSISGSLLLLGLAQVAIADENHYNNMLIGDRAAGMGGSYVAIADDPAGLFYNPSGIVHAGGSGFSASANAFHTQTTTYKKVLSGADWTRSSSVLVPNFFGMVQPLGPGVAGFSYAVVDSALEDQDQSFNNTPTAGATYNINFNNQDNTYNIGPSFAYEVSKTFSIGITLYGHYRKQEVIFNQLITDMTDPNYDLSAEGNRQLDTSTVDDPDDFLLADNSTLNTNHWESTYKAVTEYGIRPMLGIMWSPAEKLSLGLTVSKTMLLNSTTQLQNSCFTTDWDGILEDDALNQVGTCRYNDTTISKHTLNGKREFPLTFNFGAAYFASPSLLLTASAWMYQPMNGLDAPLFNYAAGMEYFLNGQWAVRLGGFSNMAATPELQAGLVGQEEHIDMFGGSFSITHFTRTTSITAGINSSIGTGKAQVIGGSSAIQDAESFSFTGFLSTAYSF